MDSLSEMWEAACQYIKTEGGITSPVFNLWIAPLRVVNFDGEKVTLGIDNDFKFGVVEKRFNSVLEQAFFNVLGFEVQVEIILLEKEPEPEEAQAAEQNGNERGSLLINDRNNSFENFVVGKSNNYAYAAAKRSRKTPAGLITRCSFTAKAASAKRIF